MLFTSRIRIEVRIQIVEYFRTDVTRKEFVKVDRVGDHDCEPIGYPEAINGSKRSGGDEIGVLGHVSIVDCLHHVIIVIENHHGDDAETEIENDSTHHHVEIAMIFMFDCFVGHGQLDEEEDENDQKGNGDTQKVPGGDLDVEPRG